MESSANPLSSQSASPNLDSSSFPRANLSLLPPELLLQIFLPPCFPTLTSSLSSFPSPDEPLHLPPSSIPISRALLPFARANAYRALCLRGEGEVERFGEMVSEEGNAWMGEMVRRVEITERAPRRARRGKEGKIDEEEEWSKERLEAAKVKAFDALSRVEGVVVSLSDPSSILPRGVMASAAFNAPGEGNKRRGVKLLILGDEPVSFDALRYLQEGKAVREVEVRGAMRVKSETREEGERWEDVFEVREGRGAEKEGGVERLRIECEPHAAGFSPFLSALSPSLKALHLRCTSTDSAQVFGSSAVPAKVKEGLEEIEWIATGYWARPLDTSFASYRSLRRLTLRSTTSSTLILTALFLSSLLSLPQLSSLALHGPTTAGGRADETVGMAAEWVEAVEGHGRSEGVGKLRELRRVVLDVRVGERERREAVELQTQRLLLAAEKLGIEVGGTTMATPQSSLVPANAFTSFVDASPTPFHAVHNAVKKLETAGFVRLHERSSWSTGSTKLARGGKYFVTRNESSIIAFTVPPEEEVKLEEDGSGRKKPLGMSIVGAHTDSPRFIVKPVSKREKAGFAQVSCETYGGGLWATWMDRDLGIAGRVIVSGAKGASSSTYTSHLVHVPQPILRMPTIAIHLDRTQNDKFAYNPETQQVPILALASKELNKAFAEENSNGVEGVSFADPLDITSHHHPVLLHTVARELSEQLKEQVTPAQLHDFELSLFDAQPATVGGALNEFIFSPRIDNLFSSFCAIEGLVLSSQSSLPSDGRVSMIALFDNEEVGSVSAYGAESNFIESVIERVAVALKDDGETEAEAYQRTLASSYLLSTDVGHALHPGFVDKHEENHRPYLNAGIAIKTNSKQRYATTSQTVFPLRRIAAEAGVPLQEYLVRNDMACGSTIGPLVSKIGLRTVDIGAPCLSMHSIREMAGVKDVDYLIKLFERFFERFGEVDTLALTVD
ncbi:hypothetical protein JCM8547_006546 [Rhodosporidiobolus lusitaniae]